MKNICETCKSEYEGHHRSKHCPSCKGKALGKKTEPLATMSAPVSAEKIESSVTIDDKIPNIVAGSDLSCPDWHAYGQCQGGYEFLPGWVYANNKIVSIQNAPKDVLMLMQDAFQRQVINRTPILGDFDHPSSK